MNPQQCHIKIYLIQRLIKVIVLLSSLHKKVLTKPNSSTVTKSGFDEAPAISTRHERCPINKLPEYSALN